MVSGGGGALVVQLDKLGQYRIHASSCRRRTLGVDGARLRDGELSLRIDGRSRRLRALGELAARISVCRACPRLVDWREEVAEKTGARLAAA